jgi:hypothetical protein
MATGDHTGLTDGSGSGARRTADWRAANRPRALQAQRDCNRKLKEAAYKAYGGFRCACCGEAEPLFLSLDHVNNDGAAHRKVFDRRKLYKWLEPISKLLTGIDQL